MLGTVHFRVVLSTHFERIVKYKNVKKMKHLFYFLTLFPIVWETMNLVSIKKTHNFAMSFKDKKAADFTSTQKAFAFCQCGYLVWRFIGLFSFQWAVFLFLFLFSLVPKKVIYYRYFDAVISLATLLFIILNSYHFKIDTWSFVKSVLHCG
jgi:hypothetical protein